MFKKLFFASLIFTSILNSQEPNLLGSLFYLEVNADVETEPVFAGDDAAAVSYTHLTLPTIVDV